MRRHLFADRIDQHRLPRRLGLAVPVFNAMLRAQEQTK